MAKQVVSSSVRATKRTGEEAGIDPSTVNIHNVGTAIAYQRSLGELVCAASIPEDAALTIGAVCNSY